VVFVDILLHSDICFHIHTLILVDKTTALSLLKNSDI